MKQKGLTEVRWHARAGQGAVTAAKVLADCALKKGKYVQAFPEYGPERMGAPLRAYTRISERPITLHCQITDPDIVVVLDPTLLDVEDVTAGLVKGGTVIVNSTESPEALRKRLGLDGEKVYTVDATGISIDELKRNIPNTGMLAALAKVTGFLSVDDIIEEMKAKLEGKFRPEIVEGNVRAIRRAFEEVVA